MQQVISRWVEEKSEGSSSGEDALLELARNSGFVKRNSGKLTPMILVSCLLHFVAQSKMSFRLWASWITLHFVRISKQALWKRIDASAVDFLRDLTCKLMKLAADGPTLEKSGVFAPFSRVLVQDSTTISLPPKFRDLYPGAANRHSSYATMKIQLIYDLLAEVPSDFSLSSFRKNDQAASPEVVDQIGENDLILRDLGYFVLDVFEEIHEKGAYFLSRYRFGTNVYLKKDAEKTFDLAKHLRAIKKEGSSSLDMNVFLGAENRLKVRLIARRVPKKIADERKRKAKTDRDQSLNPGRDRLSMLNWEVLITNVDETIWNAETVTEVYGFRWRIEMVFKIWKSYFKLPDIPDSCSQRQLECLVYTRLIFSTIYHAAIWIPCRNALNAPERQQWVSPFKLASLVPLHLNDFLLLAATGRMHDKLAQLVKDFATYDKRNRMSFEEILFYYCNNHMEEIKTIDR